MRKSTLLLSFLFSLVAVSAQNENNNWIFGNGLGLDFSGGTPVVTNSSLNGWDNSASISDSAGNLLFYTNGELIYNKNGTVMPNGSGIQGDSTGGSCATIVKLPGANVYYIFTLDDAFTNNYGARYTVVDMSLDGGLGDVDVNQKNVAFVANNSEKLVPVQHGDGVSIWIIIKEAGTNVFHAYLLTSVGLQPTPITSSIGGIYNNSQDNLGQLTVNKTGDKLAAAYYQSVVVELYDFNNYLGFITKPIALTGLSGAIGVEFSPDGSKLYTTGLLSADLNQFDLSTYTQSAISASKTVVGTIPASWATYRGGYMALGPDGKIYVVPTFSSNLGRIENPNSLGNACNYNGTAINLAPKTVDAGLVTKIGVSKANCTIQVINEIRVIDGSNSSFKLFPNPTNGNVNIQYSSNNAFDVSIYDIQGRLVMEKMNERTNATLNINGLAKGTYVIKLSDKIESTEITKKIILN